MSSCLMMFPVTESTKRSAKEKRDSDYKDLSLYDGTLARKTTSSTTPLTFKCCLYLTGVGKKRKLSKARCAGKKFL